VRIAFGPSMTATLAGPAPTAQLILDSKLLTATGRASPTVVTPEQQGARLPPVLHSYCAPHSNLTRTIITCELFDIAERCSENTENHTPRRM
jgi:hypothetical protein